MRRTLLVGLFAAGVAVMLTSAVPARALVAIMPQVQGPARAVQADVIVVGRVVALEDKDVKVGAVTYRIAVVNVSEAIKGTKEQMIKVGFIPTPKGPLPPGGVLP